MTKKQLKKEIKEEQKELAKKIKELKSKRKTSTDGYVDGLWYASDRYRHRHIAYCQFFNNTPYGMIEQTCNEDPRKSTIKDYMTSWENKIDEEVICHCS